MMEILTSSWIIFAKPSILDIFESPQYAKILELHFFE